MDFDFDYWARLARDDPERFERERKAAVQRVIDEAPLHRREKLTRLQWKVDKIIETSGHPLGATIKISGLMWDSFLALDEHLTTLCDVLHGRRVKPLPRSTNVRREGVVLSFTPRQPAV